MALRGLLQGKYVLPGAIDGITDRIKSPRDTIAPYDKRLIKTSRAGLGSFGEKSVPKAK
jgi:hypothetical protein